MRIIKTISDLNLKNYGNVFVVELITNDGNIYENMGQAVITFNEEKFNIYIFKGIFKKEYTNISLEYNFDDIKDVEFGRYGFKHPYVKIIFNVDEYIVFSYYFKIKNHNEQKQNINNFFEILGEVEVKI